MSDQRLRELERRWKETGSPDDEAAYLLERVRVGDLTRERLELAAYCGHEGAMRAVGCTGSRPGHRPLDIGIDMSSVGQGLTQFLEWLGGLPDWALPQATLEAAREVLGIWERREGTKGAPHELLAPEEPPVAPSRLEQLQEVAELDVPRPASTVLLAAIHARKAIADRSHANAKEAVLRVLIAAGEDLLMPLFPRGLDASMAPEAPDPDESLAIADELAQGILGRTKVRMAKGALRAWHGKVRLSEG